MAAERVENELRLAERGEELHEAAPYDVAGAPVSRIARLCTAYDWLD